jgi:hypothetical protein
MKNVIALLLMFCVPSVLESQKRPSRFTNEAVVFSGMMLKPGSRTTMGAGFGFGIGKSMINFEMAGEPLGPAALGFGEFLYPNENGINRWPVSRSRLFEVGLSYQRDIIGVRNGLLTLYGAAGGGYLRNQFTVTHPCTFLTCFQGTANTPPSSDANKTGNFGISLAPGVRVRVWRSMGVRGEVKFWNTNGGRITPGGRGYPFTTNSDRIVRATLGVYVHSRYNGWLKK